MYTRANFKSGPTSTCEIVMDVPDKAGPLFQLSQRPLQELFWLFRQPVFFGWYATLVFLFIGLTLIKYTKISPSFFWTDSRVLAISLISKHSINRQLGIIIIFDQPHIRPFSYIFTSSLKCLSVLKNLHEWQHYLWASELGLTLILPSVTTQPAIFPTLLMLATSLISALPELFF